eukprot:Nk52_evm9s284 gene=Nk52_evmTU9s284
MGVLKEIENSCMLNEESESEPVQQQKRGLPVGECGGNRDQTVKRAKGEEKRVEGEGEEEAYELKYGTQTFGIQPEGNRYYNGDRSGVRGCDNMRNEGLGDFKEMKDQTLLEMLGVCLGPADLCRLCQVSKYFYVLASNELLWRDVYLAEFRNEFHFVNGSWKESFRHQDAARRAIKAGRDGEVKLDPEFISPMRVQGIYSDFLFHQWMCSSQELNKDWMFKIDNIDRASGISVEDFIAKYELQNKPVLIQNEMKNWDAFSKWDKSYLKEAFTNTKFQAEAASVTMKEYFRYSENQKDESPLYLFDKDFVGNMSFSLKKKNNGECNEPNLSKNFPSDEFFSVPDIFKEDLFQVLGEERPDYRWLIIGPARSGSTFHKDPNGTSAWNAVIRGKKKWILLPPDVTPPGVIPSSDEGEVTTPESIVDWFLNFYEACAELHVKPIECVAQEGDIMFIPSGWWHAVINIEESSAITQNFVSSSNLKRVWNFISGKPEQVSGFCGEKPLHEVFRERMLEQKPEIWREIIKPMEEKQKAALANVGRWKNLTENKTESFSFNFGF